ncbi:zinc finger MYND domain-containing protein [Microdochium nivale]|nr:zinc finger MYND domain-containing protein [Microdochium nivale]
MSSTESNAYDTLKLLLSEMGKTSDCLRRIESLFTSLLKCELCHSSTPTETDRAYRAALVAFFKSLPECSQAAETDVSEDGHDKHWNTQNFLAMKAWNALNAIDGITAADQTRLYFIMSLQPLFAVAQQFPQNMRSYLCRCRWYCLGRQIPVPIGTYDTGPPIRNKPHSQGCADEIESRDQTPELDQEQEENVSVPLGLNFLPEHLTLPSICAYCERPAPPLICSDCAIKNNDRVAVATAYCNIQCQARHWGQHKKRCFDQRKLKNATEMIKNQFYMMQSEASAISLRGVRFLTDGLPVVELRYTPDEIFRGAHLLRSFPMAAFEAVKHSALGRQVLWNDLGDSMSMLSIYVSRWLVCTKFDIFTKIEQVRVHVKNVPLPIIIDTDNQIIPSGSAGTAADRAPSIATALASHTVLRISMRNGDVFAMDICAERFGWKENLMLWQHFLDQRV